LFHFKTAFFDCIFDRSISLSGKETAMVSKGVDYYGYINQDQFSVAFSGPDVGSTLTNANNFTQQNLQIDSSNIPGGDNYTGKYQWTALANGTVASAYNNISSLTGNIEGGTMTVMLQTPSLFTPESTVCYGFYDAGPGTSGLTNQDQSYVYFTDSMSNWMTYLTTHYQGAAGSKPFYDCVLAGAHDAGMFTLDTVNQILASPEGAVFLAALIVALPIFGGIAAAEAPTAIPRATRRTSARACRAWCRAARGSSSSTRSMAKPPNTTATTAQPTRPSFRHRSWRHSTA
jgi:hypothetical protein